MKKTIMFALIACVLLLTSSCQRTDLDDPGWDAPASFYILVEGSISPALLLIDGRIHTSEIYVKVTDNKGNPLPNVTVFFEQLPDSLSQTQLSWGYFANNQSTYQRGTDANGEVRLTFYWPTVYYSNEMWIHAVAVVNGRANRFSNVPEDFISLTMYRAGQAGAAAK